MNVNCFSTIIRDIGFFGYLLFISDMFERTIFANDRVILKTAVAVIARCWNPLLKFIVGSLVNSCVVLI